MNPMSDRTAAPFSASAQAGAQASASAQATAPAATLLRARPLRAVSARRLVSPFAALAPLALLAVLSPLTSKTAFADEIVQPTDIAVADDALAAVGRVSLVLGRAYLERDGDRETVVAGAAVSVGDRVYTEAGGHVHVRFVDDALVSVRPSSTLEIVRYDYDASQPQNSAVKFELSEGVARAISGEAAKSARERFRLNTPIAAIGVRGTDFVVSANSRTTRALVNEGAIVMAPFSSECSSDALGPCAVDAVELSQNNLQMLEVDTLARSPRLVASASARSAAAVRQSRDAAQTEDGATANTELAANDAAGDTAGGSDAGSGLENSLESSLESSLETTEVYLESVANEKVNNEVASAASSASQPDSAVDPEIPVPETPPVVLADFTPAAALSADAVASSQLVWGRWAEGFATGGNLLSVDWDSARADREVTVSASSGFILYRNEPDGGRVDQDLSLVRFDLDKAEAYYDSTNGVVAMRVGGGSLELDFVKNAFATALNLDHAATGEIDFVADGRIADGGYLLLKTDSQRVTGAVATDGSEAAYYFEQQLGDGSIQGLTLWGAQ